MQIITFHYPQLNSYLKVISFFLVLISLHAASPAWGSSAEQCLKNYYNFPMEAAIPFCKQAAEQGDASAQTRLGTYYAYKGGSAEKSKEGVLWLQKAAKQNHADAQFILGVLYELGRPVEKNDIKAREWYKKAANQNHIEASFNLGLSYFRTSTTSDPSKAIKWLKHAANHGSTLAQYNLGLIYNDNRIVAQDKNESTKWFRMAADQEYPRAQHNVGISYLFGIGAEKNYLKAKEWFEKAANQNYAFSQYALGVMYQYGLGTVTDLNAAKKWYSKPASQRYANSESALHAIQNHKSIPREHALSKIDRASFYVSELITRLPLPKIHYDNPCEALTDSRFALNKNKLYEKYLTQCEKRMLETKSAEDIFLFATQKFDPHTTGLFKKNRTSKELAHLKKRLNLERKSAKLGYFDAQHDLGTICLMFDYQKNICGESEAEKWITLAAKQSQPSLYCHANQVYPDNIDKQLKWFTLAAIANEGCGLEKVALHYVHQSGIFLPVAQAWYNQFVTVTENMANNEGINQMMLQMLILNFKERFKVSMGNSVFTTEQEALVSIYLEDIRNKKVSPTGLPESFLKNL